MTVNDLLDILLKQDPDAHVYHLYDAGMYDEPGVFRALSPTRSFHDLFVPAGSIVIADSNSMPYRDDDDREVLS